MHVLALAFVTTKHMGVLIVCMLLLCESILYIYIYIYIYISFVYLLRKMKKKGVFKDGTCAWELLA